ncbi:ribbon-helix-helix protein, CopG family [Euzebya sp.]|uniref:ribbon-helix-helix protein, CopG family n=1 Tax=Euzebya sp. TaxID=1971409 RepID=UPI0035188043
MRTTVELDDDTHAAISALARRRGDRGLSTIVQTALDLYLSSLDAEEIDATLALRGSVSETSAAQMLEEMTRVRSGWRSTA